MAQNNNYISNYGKGFLCFPFYSGYCIRTIKVADSHPVQGAAGLFLTRMTNVGMDEYWPTKKYQRVRVLFTFTIIIFQPLHSYVLESVVEGLVVVSVVVASAVVVVAAGGRTVVVDVVLTVVV